MKQYFAASLIRNGILGGGLTADDEKITYSTGKAGITKDMKHIEMRYEDIAGYFFKQVFFFPSFSIRMSDGKEHRFLVFGSRRFRSLLNSRIKGDSGTQKEGGNDD